MSGDQRCQVDRRNRPAVHEANIYNAIESSFSLLVSYTINMAVICVFAAGFYGTVGADDLGIYRAVR